MLRASLAALTISSCSSEDATAVLRERITLNDGQSIPRVGLGVCTCGAHVDGDRQALRCCVAALLTPAPAPALIGAVFTSPRCSLTFTSTKFNSSATL